MAQDRAESGILVIATFSPREGQRDTFIAMLSEMLPHYRAKPGYISLDIHTASPFRGVPHRKADNGPVVAIERWQSLEHAVAGREKEPFATFYAQMNDMIAEKDIRVLDAV